MTPNELQAILQSNKKLTLKEVQEIIWNLKNDCALKTYEDEIIKDKRKTGFYNGEVNAFYICLDLLAKVEQDNDKS